LILIVVALVFLGADAVSFAGTGGELTVRNLDMVWGIARVPTVWLDSRAGVQNHAFHGAGDLFLLALPAWAATGVLG